MFDPVGPVRIYRASASHSVNGRSLPNHPLFVGRNGVFPPVQEYLRYKAISRNRAVGTVLHDATILKQWISFLDDERLTWLEANNDVMERFVNFRFGAVSDARLQTQIHVIWDFYWVVQEKLGQVKGMVESPSRGEIGELFPISATISHRRGKGGRLMRRVGPQIGFPTLRRVALRPTPNDDQVDEILAFLLSASVQGRGVCWWLMASWMYHSTLRCMGVAGLTITALTEALCAEGITGPFGKPLQLHSIASNPAEQDLIKLKLSKLAERGRTELHVVVREKRGKQRFVPVPIDLFELNLDYIWTDRAWLIQMLERRPGFAGTDALFVSQKTGAHFEPNSISNLLKAAFKSLGIRGSAHRLRAACCMRIMRKCYIRARASHGRSWDPNSVLLEVAEIMGHDDPETLRPYLTRVEKEENLVPGSPIVVPVPASELMRGLAAALEHDDGSLQQRLASFLFLEGVEGKGEAKDIEDVRRWLRPRMSY